MDRQLISLLAHADHPIAAPLEDESVRRLLAAGVPRADARVLDLGCGEGAWLTRVLAAHPEAKAEGVDISAGALERARAHAEEAGVAERLTLHRTEAEAFSTAEPFDLVLIVGASHAFGGLVPTLDAAREHLAPGGCVLVGDAYWRAEPSAHTREILGEYEDLPTTVDKVRTAGWTPVYAHASTRHELDDYEWRWTGSLSRWALDHPEHPDSAQALKAADVHREEWLHGYRDSFGFVSLVLRRTES
ncbi:SAM-dependent methyltransferase [Streptomyces iconiensis]|uniref:Methyltransferase domain-containing protein n=1 Tax=Streptomyces iconiensis TaxID=1384038 RepID=A0ABT6ZPM4_9ACTN|nr:class I SAM-dependent methyltransferase [Streptomyces iconiensis]MDJ1130468.1 methyltransferase domain-containing protein [Streptomyces iconiensis]